MSAYRRHIHIDSTVMTSRRDKDVELTSIRRGQPYVIASTSHPRRWRVDVATWTMYIDWTSSPGGRPYVMASTSQQRLWGVDIST